MNQTGDWSPALQAGSVGRISASCSIVLTLLFFFAGLQAPAQVSSSSPTSPLLIPVRDSQTGKVGYIDRTGKVVIPFQFKTAGMFYEGLAEVGHKNKCGFINRAGVLVIPYRRCYMVEENFHEGFAVLRRSRNSKVYYIDSSGRDLKNARFAFAERFSDGLAAFKPDFSYRCCWGYIDRKGRVAITPRFEDFPGEFSEGLAAARLNGKMGFINSTGEFVIPPQFEDAYRFREGVAPVQTHGQWGYIDRTGAFVIRPQFSWARPFAEGLAEAYIDHDHGGFIDHAGKWVVEAKYRQVNPFQDGYAEVVNGPVGFIDRQDREIIPVKYSEGAYLGEGLFDLELISGNGNRQDQIRDAQGNVVYTYSFKQK